MRAARALWAGALALAVSGCMTPTSAPETSVQPAARAAPAAPKPSASAIESQRLRAYYARVQSSLVSQGLLRTDRGGVDTPYSTEQLVQNFRRIALFEEYSNVGGRIVAQQRASKLHRWDQPIRVAVDFGASVPSEQRNADRRSIERYVGRLAAATRHPIGLSSGAANFHVFIVDEGSRKALAPRIRQIIPTINEAALDTVLNLPRSSYCLVVGYDPEDDGTYSAAVAIIRSEHPDLLRLSCIHEELAQGLGLANDSPSARPSVFNDDEEFALLTTMDEHLLRILYDPRLRPGMTADEALPIVRRIAAEQMGGPS